MTKFNELLESLDENTRSTIQEAWDVKVSEARQELTAELREEFAQRYTHDKAQIAEAVDKFITAVVQKEITELAEDKKAVVQDRVRYHKSIDEHTELLNRFVLGQVAKEVRELHNDRQNVTSHVSKLDDFVTAQLSEELTEFSADRNALVEQKVKMLREGKRALAKMKKKFIAGASNLVETTVNNVVSKEIKAFRSDIIRARENEFGRQIFETFANEFRNSYLNDSKEIKTLQKQVGALNTKLKESTEAIDRETQSRRLTESKLSIVKNKIERKKVLDGLTKPLSTEKKELMSDLLKTVATDQLTEKFNKYLPSVVKADQPRKQALSESVTTVHDGNRINTAEAEDTLNPSAKVVEIEELKKLAGLRK